MDVRGLTKKALLIALLCISAYIIIPMPFSPVPIVLTNLVLALIAYILSPRDTFITVLAYVMIGAVGLPVFAGGQGGFGILVGPTGGYIWGFLMAYPLLSFVKGDRYNFWRYTLTGIFVVIPIVYIMGMAGLMFELKISMYKAFMVGVLPFIFVDVVKIILAAAFAKRIRIK